ncbi:MAG: class IV adenylate cyclase [Anaerolineae bacterium]|jgi:adenylate cyclase class 2|nr:class IV adenylate cyclase [Anaerolineae bacterium]
MNSPYRETEVKLYTPDLELMQQRLEASGAKIIAPRVYERNMRYENADKTLAPRGIVLRLREDTRVRLTYKEPGTVDRGVVSRQELEVEIGDYATMEAILGKLGFYPAMMYEKYRTTYKLMHTEIVLDELPYGNFTEIEGDFDAIDNVMEELRLDSYKRYTASYVRLFDYVCYNLRLNLQNLTFNNFDGIHVPEAAFNPPPER